MAKFGEKNGNYSPSSSFNYNPSGHHQSQGGSYQQPSATNRRRFTPNTAQQRREPFNITERLMHQNDLIIQLLKEIRDRLPALPATAGMPDDGKAATAVAGEVQDADMEESDGNTLPEAQKRNINDEGV